MKCELGSGTTVSRLRKRPADRMSSAAQISSAKICRRSPAIMAFMWCTLWMVSKLAASGSLALTKWCRYARLQQRAGGGRHRDG